MISRSIETDSPPGSPATVSAIAPYPTTQTSLAFSSSASEDRREVQVEFGPGLFGFGFDRIPFSKTSSDAPVYSTCIGKFAVMPNGKPSPAQEYNASVKHESQYVVMAV